MAEKKIAEIVRDTGGQSQYLVHAQIPDGTSVSTDILDPYRRNLQSNLNDCRIPVFNNNLNEYASVDVNTLNNLITTAYQSALHGMIVNRIQSNALNDNLGLYIPLLGGQILESQLIDLRYKDDVQNAFSVAFSGGVLTMPNYDGYTPTMSSALTISATRDHGLPKLSGSFRTHNDTSNLNATGIVTGTFNPSLNQVGIGNQLAGPASFSIDSSRQIRVPESGKIQVPNINLLTCIYLAPYMFKPVASWGNFKLGSLVFKLPLVNGAYLGKSSSMVQQ